MAKIFILLSTIMFNFSWMLIKCDYLRADVVGFWALFSPPSWFHLNFWQGSQQLRRHLQLHPIRVIISELNLTTFFIKLSVINREQWLKGYSSCHNDCWMNLQSKFFVHHQKIWKQNSLKQVSSPSTIKTVLYSLNSLKMHPISFSRSALTLQDVGTLLSEMLSWTQNDISAHLIHIIPEWRLVLAEELEFQICSLVSYQSIINIPGRQVSGSSVLSNLQQHLQLEFVSDRCTAAAAAWFLGHPWGHPENKPVPLQLGSRVVIISL